VQEHDVVVSSSSAFAHGVRKREDAVHVCYCHTPFRYAWFERSRALEEVPPPARPLLRRMLDRIRRWDRESADGVTHYVANSELCRERIQEFWGRDAPVVHPPVDVDRFETAEPEDYFLVVTELVPHKRVDMALEAARRAGTRVKVVGSGPDRERLEAGWADVATFPGRVSDEELNSLYSRARALIVPNVEEFGIAAVEAQAAGRPVVGVDAGGVRETVVDGETGVLVEDRNTDALAEALRHEEFERFSPERTTGNADRFSRQAFKERFSSEVRRVAAAA
jgi:glycosyltransferase involved in cell wall biosynthesis